MVKLTIKPTEATTENNLVTELNMNLSLNLGIFWWLSIIVGADRLIVFSDRIWPFSRPSVVNGLDQGCQRNSEKHAPKAPYSTK